MSCGTDHVCILELEGALTVSFSFFRPENDTFFVHEPYVDKAWTMRRSITDLRGTIFLALNR